MPAEKKCRYTSNPQDLSEETLAERKRALICVKPLMEVINNNAPPGVQQLAGLVISNLLGLCPVHGGPTEFNEAMQALDMSPEDLMDSKEARAVQVIDRPQGMPN